MKCIKYVTNHYLNFLISSLTVLWILFALMPSLAMAQTGAPQWSPPVEISDSGNFATTPLTVSDSAGSIHLLWNETANDTSRWPDTVYYAKWDGETWSTPQDVIYAESLKASRLLAQRLRIDELGYLHTVLVSDNGIFYLTAHVSQANNARSWKSVRIPEPAFHADLAIDATGSQVFVSYVVERVGVYYIGSMDRGITWSLPELVWSAGVGTANDWARIEIGPKGVLHLAWDVVNEATNWNHVGIGYARSLDGGQSWIDYLEVPVYGGQPSLGFDETDTIHLIWNNWVGDDEGRYHITSVDDGESWSDLQRIFEGHSGRTLWPAMIQDSAGHLNMIISTNPPDAQESNVFYTKWLGDRWSDLVRISGDRQKGEGPAVALRKGNEIHALWFTYDPVDWGIWHTKGTIDAPPIEVQPVATPLPARNEIPSSPEADSTQVDAENPESPSPEVDTGQTSHSTFASPPNTNMVSSRIAPIAISSTLVLLVIGVVVMSRGFK